jgi:RNase P subunit RPR2
MAERMQSHARRLHRHTTVVTHALRQQAGIPYEIERHVCSDCRRILTERTVRRAAA